jgi:hypothetical protein
MLKAAGRAGKELKCHYEIGSAILFRLSRTGVSLSHIFTPNPP